LTNAKYFGIFLTIEDGFTPNLKTLIPEKG